MHSCAWVLFFYNPAMRILLTNDDGIDAPGLAALYRAIQSLGEVHIIAPAKVQSATSHAVTFHRPVAVRPLKVICPLTGESFEGQAVEGRPADCVKIGLAHLVKQPVDLVISGMNRGANVGINTIYSGTVAAAREAAFIGTPAIAVSLHIGDRHRIQWDKAARYARSVIDQIVAGPVASHTLLNLNIPILDVHEPRGVKVVPISTSPIIDTYHHTRDSEGISLYHAADDFSFHETPINSDVHALYEHFITLSPLHFDLSKHEDVAVWQAKVRSTIAQAV